MSHITKQYARTEFFRLMDTLDAGFSPYAQEAIIEIRQAAMRLSNLGVRQCNGVIGPDGFAKWDDKDQEQCDRAEAKAQGRVIKALESAFDSETFARLDVELHGDPRGPSVIIHIKDGPQRVASFW